MKVLQVIRADDVLGALQPTMRGGTTPSPTQEADTPRNTPATSSSAASESATERTLPRRREC